MTELQPDSISKADLNLRAETTPSSDPNPGAESTLEAALTPGEDLNPCTESTPQPCPIRVLFDRPCIPMNTGATMRLSALTGCEFHVAGPLGFELDDTRLKRAGLDYRDRASFTAHEDLEAAYAELLPARVFAFSARATRPFTGVAYQPGDVLLFGPEPTGLAAEVLDDSRITEILQLPMLPGSRSLNLASTAAVAVYEAWRQFGYGIPQVSPDLRV